MVLKKNHLFIFLAVLKLIVDYYTLLIGAEGTRSSKMLSHFLRAVFIRGSLFNVLREKRVSGRPRRCECTEERRTARGKRVPRAEINRQI